MGTDCSKIFYPTYGHHHQGCRRRRMKSGAGERKRSSASASGCVVPRFRSVRDANFTTAQAGKLRSWAATTLCGKDSKVALKTMLVAVIIAGHCLFCALHIAGGAGGFGPVRIWAVERTGPQPVKSDWDRRAQRGRATNSAELVVASD